MKAKKIIIPVILLFISICINATENLTIGDNLTKKTYLYAVKGTDSLYLDYYTRIQGNTMEIQITKPCVIFVFGGGFAAGTRDRESYIPYFRYLTENGFKVVSIDYRLGLKNVGEQKDLDAQKFISIFENAITMAVEDLYDATNFVIKNAGEWNIDTNMIVANGSSAGAITVMHGEYNISNKTSLSEKLPEGFNYAGVISFAGAIFSTTGNINWKNKPAPILMFHGDGDRNVPYNKVELLQYGFYGSRHISRQLAYMESPYYFYDVENAAHEMADIPMNENREEIYTFLKKYILNKTPFMIHSTVKQIGKPQLEKNLGIRDYIDANFGIDAGM
jgi:predicted esterase